MGIRLPSQFGKDDGPGNGFVGIVRVIGIIRVVRVVRVVRVIRIIRIVRVVRIVRIIGIHTPTTIHLEGISDAVAPHIFT
ncbi:MAG: hypothetical protein K6C30_07070, partial [Bacteroidaceae bacterium]|nr:hypothetical protein [Bacteroidaceae bacterium]